MADFSLVLHTKTQRELAASYCLKANEGTVVEWSASNRTLEQNAALHGLLAQVVRQRPTLNNVRMNVPLYKLIFLDALGEETRMMPKLEGDGYFAVGHQTSKLSKARFTELIELILAWCAREGLTVAHFDG